jgi:MFS family permease
MDTVDGSGLPFDPTTMAAVAPTSGSGSRIGRRLSALDSGAYRQFLLASLAGSMGGWIAGTAQGWLVLDLTGSSAALGWTSAAGGVSFLLLLPIAGVLADRIETRGLIIWTRIVVAVCAAVLALLVSTGVVTVTHIIILALISGCAYALATPALQAMIGSLVRPNEVGAAVGLNSAQFNLARVVGPPIAGLAVAAGHIALAFWGSAVGALVALVAFRRLPIVHRRRDAHGPLLHSMREGVQWLRARPELFALVILTGAPALLTLNYLVLLPVFARDELGVGPAGLGLLASGAGLGAFSGAMIVSIGHPSGGSGRFMLGALSVMTVAVLVFSLSSSFALSLAALGVVGGAQVAYYATANALLQTQVPTPVLGRVLSLYAFVSQGLIPIGSILIGQLADSTTPKFALAGAAGTCLIVTVAVAWSNPGLRDLKGRHATLPSAVSGAGEEADYTAAGTQPETSGSELMS